MSEQGSLEGGGEATSTDKKSTATKYRILWGRMPDPDADDGNGRPVFREILNPDVEGGWYEATSAETARRRAFEDDRTDQYPFIQKALHSHGLILKHVAVTSWGEPDPSDPLKVETVEKRTGRV
jgi:hypothetical protein